MTCSTPGPPSLATLNSLTCPLHTRQPDHHQLPLGDKVNCSVNEREKRFFSSHPPASTIYLFPPGQPHPALLNGMVVRYGCEGYGALVSGRL